MTYMESLTRPAVVPFGPLAGRSRRAPLRIGLIGCGYWGPKLLRNFQTLPATQVSIVSDLRPGILAETKQVYPDLETTTDYRELLYADVDAVVIATPVSTHYRLACEALRLDKHVLVEKPMARTSAEGRELVRLARERGLTLMVGHTFEYNPAVEMLRDIVASGEIGEAYYVSTARTNLGLFQPDINVIWDLAPHDLSILLFVLGVKPINVSAAGAAYVQKGIQDVARMTVNFEGGVQAHILVSWLDPCKVRRVTVVGNKKMVVYDDLEPLEKIKIYDKGVEVPPRTADFGEFQLSYRYGDITIPRVPSHEPLASECADFAECILHNRTPRSCGEVGLNVVRILESADKSLQNGGMREPIAW